MTKRYYQHESVGWTFSIIVKQISVLVGRANGPEVYEDNDIIVRQLWSSQPFGDVHSGFLLASPFTSAPAILISSSKWEIHLMSIFTSALKRNDVTLLQIGNASLFAKSANPTFCSVPPWFVQIMYFYYSKDFYFICCLYHNFVAVGN